MITSEELAAMKDRQTEFGEELVGGLAEHIWTDCGRLIAEVEELQKRNEWLSTELSVKYAELEALI